MTYDPNEFQVTMNVMMNDDVLYMNMFSGKNPPPICVPLGSTPIELCMKFFNIFTPGRNIHMCFDMEAKVREKPYLVMCEKWENSEFSLGLIETRCSCCTSTACEWVKTALRSSSRKRTAAKWALARALKVAAEVEVDRASSAPAFLEIGQTDPAPQLRRPPKRSISQTQTRSTRLRKSNTP